MNVCFGQIVGVEQVCFIQKNSLDRRARTLSIEANNETFASRILINEHCFYSVSGRCIIIVIYQNVLPAMILITVIIWQSFR